MRRALLPFLPSAMTAVLLMASGVAVAVVVVVSVLAVPKPVDAATRLVTKSFSNANPINIPGSDDSGAASPYPSSIASSFPRGSTVRDVNVFLRSYTHTWPDDVDVLLVHAARNRTILSDAGGEFDVNNITIALDDEAVNGPVGGTDGETRLRVGRFKPFNYEGGDTFNSPAPNPASVGSALSGFDGSSARGGWRLFVQDDNFQDTGTFAGGWTIQVTAAVPQ
jgi:hypothetical protein